MKNPDEIAETPSTAEAIVPKLRLNREKVRVLNVRSSVRTGGPSDCSGTIFHCAATIFSVSLHR